MARKMTEWPSKRGPITKIMPSDGCIGDTVPLAVGKWYEFHEFGWHMGNVGYYYENEWRYLCFLVPEGSRILELGCGTGQLLAALKPARGVGIDISDGMIEVARRNYPDLEFYTGDIEEPETIDALMGPFVSDISAFGTN